MSQILVSLISALSVEELYPLANALGRVTKSIRSALEERAISLQEHAASIIQSQHLVERWKYLDATTLEVVRWISSDARDHYLIIEQPRGDFTANDKTSALICLETIIWDLRYGIRSVLASEGQRFDHAQPNQQITSYINYQGQELRDPCTQEPEIAVRPYLTRNASRRNDVSEVYFEFGSVITMRAIHNYFRVFYQEALGCWSPLSGNEDPHIDFHLAIPPENPNGWTLRYEYNVENEYQINDVVRYKNRSYIKFEEEQSDLDQLDRDKQIERFGACVESFRDWMKISSKQRAQLRVYLRLLFDEDYGGGLWVSKNLSARSSEHIAEIAKNIRYILG